MVSNSLQQIPQGALLVELTPDGKERPLETTLEQVMEGKVPCSLAAEPTKVKGMEVLFLEVPLLDHFEGTLKGLCMFHCLCLAFEVSMLCSITRLTAKAVLLMRTRQTLAPQNTAESPAFWFSSRPRHFMIVHHSICDNKNRLILFRDSVYSIHTGVYSFLSQEALVW